MMPKKLLTEEDDVLNQCQEPEEKQGQNMPFRRTPTLGSSKDTFNKKDLEIKVEATPSVQVTE